MKRIVGLAVGTVLLAGSSAADNPTRHKGRCQSLTILDRSASLRCADEMFVRADATSIRAFIFRSEEAVVLFAAIDGKPDATGTRHLPLNRVELGLRGEVGTIPVLSGSCRSVDAAATWRAETVCEAATVKGRFAAQFVTIDGATEPVQPNERPVR